MLLRSKESDIDIDELWLFIAKDNLPAADNIVEEIDEKLKLLEANPFIGRKSEIGLLGFDNVRIFPIRKYLIFYAPIEKGIHFLRIIHGAMDWQT